MFFGALALSTVTYVGCKDYDDDIDNLQTQIDANKASIAELQNFVKEGKWVTAVETITDGFKITFNDGKSYSIVSGADGAAGTKIEIDSATKNWIIDGKDTGICSEGKKGDKGDQGDQGDQGEDGYAPQISEDGYWMVWDAEAGEPKKTDVKAATDIYVTADANNPLVWVLNILNKETGEWETVSMPKAARITSMRALGEQGGSIDFSSTEANATLYYGVVGKDVKFNGKSYPKGTFLSARGSMIHALQCMNHATSSRQERSFWIRFSVKFNIFSYYSIIQGSVCLSRRKIDTSTLFAKCTHTSDTSSLRHRNSFPFSRFLIEYIQNPNQWIISISSYIDICSSFNICFFRFSGFCIPNHPISVF